MDKIIISGLKFNTLIGTLDWEKQTPQNITLDLTIATDAKKAATQDDLNDALDYTKIVDHLNGYIKTHHPELIETLAENLATEILTHFDTSWVQVTLHKPGAVLQAKEIAITIERHK
ncbi:MAG: dihydroneopterin aldolase [Proteobacteria bacterium]|nr:dihydroneopterin aldolase [Pseudomonadota bacterium]